MGASLCLSPQDKLREMPCAAPLGQIDLLKREKQRREDKTVNAIVNDPEGAMRGEG